MKKFQIDFSQSVYPGNFKKELQKYADMVCENKESKMVIDNEQSRLKEKYGLSHKLNDYGYRTLKRTLKKYWEGKRLDDQELTISYILLPKLILYEKIQFRMLDMVNELENENKKRWGDDMPPTKNMIVIKNMLEENPDFIEDGWAILDGITTKHLEELGVGK